VTPDSFSDGGKWMEVAAALDHAEGLIQEGADLLDVGGESTRPGTSEVSIDEELRRVIPVIEALVRRFPEVPISVDTTKSSVAEAAVSAGAQIVNDVSGGRLDDRLLGVCAATGVGVVLMHSRGGVSAMATFTHATYGEDIVGEVRDELQARAEAAVRAGVRPDRLVLDPGIGFAKRTVHSLAVLAGLARIDALGFPVMVGVSRKRFIGELSHREKPAERLAGTIAANVVALTHGARLFRVHDVRAHREALDVAQGIMGADRPALPG
jgi:dihydropteroate synthase